MVKQPTPVRIKAEFLERLKDYSAKTGVPVSRCIDEAVSDWLNCVAPARLRALERPVFGGGASGLSGHPHVTQEEFVAQGEERMKATGKK
jgi:hypothetical protein